MLLAEAVRTRRWTAAHPWFTNAALLLLGSGLFMLARQLVSEHHRFTIGFSGVACCSAILYAAAVLVALTQPTNRLTFPMILAVAILCRLVTLFPPPFLSTDVYRYAWDGVVQHAHISPYRYVPGDPALTFLREPNRDLFDNINRRNYAVTIYPPGAQFLFYLITLISPAVTCMKMAMVLFEGLTMFGLVRLLGEFGHPRERALLYAWCPLLVWEIGEAGHLDSAAMAFIVLALLARYRKQAILTGLFLGIAIMIKMYPVVLLPALFRRGEYKMPAMLAAVIAFSYACYSSVGMRVFGFLGGYVQEEGIKSGERYFLLELIHHVAGLQNFPAALYLLGCAFVFAVLGAWCWSSCCQSDSARSSVAQTRWFDLPPRADFLPPATALAFVLMLLFSPHYPWYVAWLLPFFTLAPTLTLFTYICGLFYLCTTPLAVGRGPSQFLLNEILYASVLLALVVEVLLRRWPLHRRIIPKYDTLRRSD